MRISLLVGSTLHPLAGQAGVGESVHSSAGNLRISESIREQVSERIRAATATRYDRANLSAELSFDTVRGFTSAEAAENWAADYSATMPRAGTVVLDTSERNGYPATVTPGGTLTSDGSTPVVFGAMSYAGMALSRPKFTAGANYAEWLGTYWEVKHAASGATFRSTDGVASPDLCTTWTAVAPATAAGMTVAATYPGRRWLANAIVHPPDRRINGVSVSLSYRITGGAITATDPAA
jgi:hypothetical protein